MEWIVHAVMATYGYEEIRTPAFEPTELFRRGIGEDTDIVNKEMYTFTDQGGKSLTLKPELTAPVVRAYIQNNMQKERPLTRLYYLDALYRQERPQKGRLRQFHQFGVEAIGSPHPEQDVEVIAIAWDICTLFAPEGLELRLNSLGSPAAREEYLQHLRTAVEPHASRLGATDRRRLKTNPLRIFDSKDEATRAVLQEFAPVITDFITPEDRQHYEQVQAGLAALGIPFSPDPLQVRGLDYYTRTTFEIVSTRLGAQNAVCGGGRYDRLLSQLGGPDLPAAGFAAGLERLLLIAGDKLKSRVTPRKTEIYMVVLGEKACREAQLQAQKLRTAGYHVLLETLRRSAKAQFREANRSGAHIAVILGEDELTRGVCAVKRLDTGEQREVPLEKLTQHLEQVLHDDQPADSEPSE